MKHGLRLTCLFVALFSGNAAFAQDEALIARAKAIQAKILTIDTHVDIPFNFSTDAYDMMKPGPRGQQVHLPTMISGGMDAPFLIVFVGQGERTTAGYAKALADAFTKFAAIHKLTEEIYPDKIELAYTAADVRRIHATGKKVAIIGMENGYPMGKDLRLLDQFHDYGARYLALVHNGHNDLADSAQPDKRLNEPAAEHNGLSPLGKRVVKRLNELGIMVDVSHSSEKSTLDMLAASAAPVIASHSAVKGVSDHPRNLSDAALEGIKRSNGVAQIVAFDSYLKAVPAEKTAAVAALDKDMGVDHVGIASDFNGGGGIDGWDNAGETFNVTVELVRRGYTEEQIAKIWGGNLLRVMGEVERYAANVKMRAK